jgi:uncharacterized OB-fold protein
MDVSGERNHMSVLDRLLGANRGREASLVCECRRCGTSVDPTVVVCPECGERDVVRYEI